MGLRSSPAPARHSRHRLSVPADETWCEAKLPASTRELLKDRFPVPSKRAKGWSLALPERERGHGANELSHSHLTPCCVGKRPHESPRQDQVSRDVSGEVIPLRRWGSHSLNAALPSLVDPH